MLLYFNKNGQLLEKLEYGSVPRVGMTSFMIFAYFDGIDISGENTVALIRFKRPDLEGSEFPDLFMMKAELNYDEDIANPNNVQGFSSNFKEANNPYSCFVFDFNKLENNDGVVTLLDTPGTWEASITIFGTNGHNVVGLVRFYVEPSVSADDDEPLEPDYSIITRNVANALTSFVQKSDGTYMRSISNFIDKATNGTLLKSIFVVGSYVYDPTTNCVYVIDTVTDNAESEGYVSATYTNISIMTVGSDTLLSSLVGVPRIIYYSTDYYFGRVINPSGTTYSFEFEALTSSKRYVGTVSTDKQLSEVFISSYQKIYALDSEVVKVDGDQSISGELEVSGIKTYSSEDNVTIHGSYFEFENNDETDHTNVEFPITGTDENVAYQSYVNDKASKKQAIGTFSTSDFAKASGTDYYQQTVTISGYIEDSDMLLITWAGSFILCTIPASGIKGHTVASLLNTNGNYQVVRVGYTLLNDNTELKIELGSEFTPKTGYNGVVMCIKL